MMNTKQLTIIKKDMRSITSNKSVFSVILIVPLVLTIILPAIIIFIILKVPDITTDLQKLIDMLPVITQGKTQEQLILGIVLNKLMPAFFLMIPIMSSSVMAASSFVGEKEKHTLETLLYSPLTLKQLFQSKILASFAIGMIVSLISFTTMLIVLELETFLLSGNVIIPDFSWIVVLLLVAPATSLVAISITVHGSAKAKTMEEAQQRAIFLILPLVLLILGQFTGVIMVSTSFLLVLGIILGCIAAFLMKNSVGKFTYEKLLRG